MQSKSKVSLILLLIPILICLVIGVYYIRLSMMESIRFDKDSIEYRLLTPDILKNISTEDIGKIKHYYYSAADGHKPLINSIEMVSDKSREYVENILENYLVNHQFIKIKPGEFKRDGQEVSISFEKADSKIWNINITLVEMI